MGMFLPPESSFSPPTSFSSFYDMPPSSSSAPFTDPSTFAGDHFSSVFSPLHDSMTVGPPFEPPFRCNSGSGMPHLRNSPSSPAMLDSPLSTSPPLYAHGFPPPHMGPHPGHMMEPPHKGPPPMRGHSFEGFPSHPIFADMPPPSIHVHRGDQHGPPPGPPMPPTPGPASGPFPPPLAVQDLPAGTFPDLPDLRDPSYYSTLSHCPERQAVLLTSRIKGKVSNIEKTRWLDQQLSLKQCPYPISHIEFTHAGDAVVEFVSEPAKRRSLQRCPLKWTAPQPPSLPLSSQQQQQPSAQPPLPSSSAPSSASISQSSATLSSSSSSSSLSSVPSVQDIPCRPCTEDDIRALFWVGVCTAGGVSIPDMAMQVKKVLQPYGELRGEYAPHPSECPPPLVSPTISFDPEAPAFSPSSSASSSYSSFTSYSQPAMQPSAVPAPASFSSVSPPPSVHSSLRLMSSAAPSHPRMFKYYFAPGGRRRLPQVIHILRPDMPKGFPPLVARLYTSHGPLAVRCEDFGGNHTESGCPNCRRRQQWGA